MTAIAEPQAASRTAGAAQPRVVRAGALLSAGRLASAFGYGAIDYAFEKGTHS
ncbi:hypothetical protein [Nocardia sp. bgisy134]|uniref:hypothetical protein n=1 Tax=unclassified Nocardia TaxID=2637762 RepID=UPI003D73A162